MIEGWFFQIVVFEGCWVSHNAPLCSPISSFLTIHNCSLSNLWSAKSIPIRSNSFFIGPESDHWECLSVTHWLTHCRLVNLIDVTLACEDGNSKLVEVVTVVEVDDEKRVDNSLVQIWKVNFGHKVKFLFGLWGQGFKVCSRFWSWCSGKILKLKFGHYFAADAWLWLWSSFLVVILKLGVVKIF